MPEISSWVTELFSSSVMRIVFVGRVFLVSLFFSAFLSRVLSEFVFLRYCNAIAVLCIAMYVFPSKVLNVQGVFTGPPLKS